jgi:hypothetical protein
MTAVPESFRRYGEESLPQAPAFGPGKDGVLEATLAREPGGETRLLSEYVKVPYHLTGTLDNDPAPGMTTLCVQEPTGGVAQGDRHVLDIDAGERARGHVTTQSATKVHSMRANYAHLDATFRASIETTTAFPCPPRMQDPIRSATKEKLTNPIILVIPSSPCSLGSQVSFASTGWEHRSSRLSP